MIGKSKERGEKEEEKGEKKKKKKEGHQGPGDRSSQDKMLASGSTHFTSAAAVGSAYCRVSLTTIQDQTNQKTVTKLTSGIAVRSSSSSIAVLPSSSSSIALTVMIKQASKSPAATCLGMHATTRDQRKKMVSRYFHMFFCRTRTSHARVRPHGCGHRLAGDAVTAGENESGFVVGG